eukprot:scaffold21162_cov65-Attheya_sp.AAC.13
MESIEMLGQWTEPVMIEIFHASTPLVGPNLFYTWHSLLFKDVGVEVGGYKSEGGQPKPGAGAEKSCYNCGQDMIWENHALKMILDLLR